MPISWSAWRTVARQHGIMTGGPVAGWEGRMATLARTSPTIAVALLPLSFGLCVREMRARLRAAAPRERLLADPLADFCAAVRSRLVARSMAPLVTAVLSAALLCPEAALAGFKQQGPKLVGTGAVGNAQQGRSVALSADGNTVIVGGISDNNTAGAAWVFTRSGGVWSQQGGPWAIVGQRDFNGDGFADILWRNGTSGQTMIWLMNGASLIGTGSPGTVTTGWAVAGTGDFNGDGFGDVLWYNATTGQAVIWLLSGTSVIGGGSPGSATGPWTIAGT